MPVGDGSDAVLAAILERLDFHLAEPLDFAHGSPDVVRVLSAAAAYFNTLAVADFGGRQGKARHEGLVEQVVAVAFQTYRGIEPHPTPFEKAAMLLRGITAGHPFQDGNKRTGFLLAAFYLAQVGSPLPRVFSVDAAEQLCMQISAGAVRDVAEIAGQLRRIWEEE